MNKIGLALCLLACSVGTTAEFLYFEWTRPTARQNGEALARSEILQYEIRGFTSDSEIVFDKVIVNPYAISTVADIDDLLNIDYYVIAVSDTDGLYSEFVAITPTDSILEGFIPPVVKGFKVFSR